MKRKHMLIKDFLKEVRHSRNRFLSILLITLLGVAFFAGIRAAGPDMRLSADTYYDDAVLMDIRVLGTLGLTDGDVEAIADVDGVTYATGAYSADLLVRMTDEQPILHLMSYTDAINLITVEAGRIPEETDEIFLDADFVSDYGYEIGDQIELVNDADEDAIEDVLQETTYTIVGYGTSPFYLSLERGSASVGNGSVGGFAVLAPECFLSEVYTEIYLSTEGTEELICYSDAYEDRVDEICSAIEDIADERCETRLVEVKEDAWEEIDDGQAEIDDARQEIADAKEELADAKQELADGREELEDGKKELEDGRAELEEKEQELADAEALLDEKEAELLDGQAELDEKEQELLDAEAELAASEQELSDAKAELAAKEQELADAKAELDAKETELDAGEAELDEKEAGLDAADEQIRAALAELDEKEAELDAGEAELDAAQETLDEKRAAYQTQSETTLKELSAKEEEINAQLAALEEQRAAYETAYQEYLEKKSALEADSEATDEEWAALAAVEEALAHTKETLDAGEAECQAALAQIQAARQELEAAGQAIDDAQAEIDEKRAAVDAGREQIQAAREELTAKQAEVDAGRAAIAENRETIAQGREQLAAAKEQIASGEAKIAAAKEQLASGEAKIAAAKEQLASGEAEIAAAKEQLLDGASQIAEARLELEDGASQIAEAKQELSDGEAELADAEQELLDGEAEYEEKAKDAEEEIADAEEEIADGEAELADAKQEVEDLEMPKWYVLGRNTLETYVEYGQNSDRIEAIGNVFPVIFFMVAAMVCLTTMTRMVEENRTQIGTFKALGYKKSAIAGKYFCYAFLASFTGSLIGLAAGQAALPRIIINAYKILYNNLPVVRAPLYVGYSVSSTVLAVVITCVAAAFACWRELMAVPAQLMRPAAPQNGKRILLEYVSILWKHLNFSQKAAARNLFRYKKRFIMTVLGIGGCMGLLMVGFGLRDSIMTIGDRQFEKIQVYSSAITMEDENLDENREALLETLAADDAVDETLETLQYSTDVKSGDESRNVYILVPSDVDVFEDFVKLHDRVSQKAYRLADDGVIITEKLAKLLDVEAGDTITIMDGDTVELEVLVSAVCESYFYHYVFMTPGLYEKLYGEAPEYSQICTINGDDSEEAQDAFQAKYMQEEGVSQITFLSSIEDRLSDMLRSMDSVIYVIVIAAGLLAFVVLYNLNNINISERRRELATLKVLGFYEEEVSAYVFRENVILTVIGAALGAVFGYFLHRFIILTAEVDIMMFGRQIKIYSYIYSILLTFLFSFLVNLFMHGQLKRLNMVESMKSVE